MTAQKTTLRGINPQHVWILGHACPAGVDLVAEDECLILPGDVVGGDGPWWDLLGTLDEYGRWIWDRVGSPVDHGRNSVSRIVAYPPTSDNRCILVQHDSGVYSIPGAAEPEDWDTVCGLARTVEHIEHLTGWGQWRDVYLVDGERHYFTDSDYGPRRKGMGVES